MDQEVRHRVQKVSPALQLAANVHQLSTLPLDAFTPRNEDGFSSIMPLAAV